MKTLIPIPIGVPIEKFPLDPAFWPAQFMFCIMFSKQKPSSSNRRFHWRILRGIFSVKVTRKWRQRFVLILIHSNLFVIRYIFWLEIAVRHEYVYFLFSYNYMHKYKTEDTHSCVIILIRTELKASYSRVKTLPNDILLNQ